MQRLGNSNHVQRALVGFVAPLNDKPRDITCMACKRPIEDGVINYVRGGWNDTAKRTVIKPCPTCSQDEATRQQAKRQAEVITRVFGQARIPWRAREWTFASYPVDADQNAKMQVQGFVSRHLGGDQASKRMFYLGGSTGRCKTSLALSALKDVLTHGRSGLYLMTAELMLKLQSTLSNHVDLTQDELLAAVTSVEWLILDDLAVEAGRDSQVSAYTLKMLYLLIQKRADLGYYTIVTSNLSLSDLERYWRPPGTEAGAFHEGKRIVERLREYCEGCAVQGRNQRS